MSPFGCSDAQQELPERYERLKIAEGNSIGSAWGSYQPPGKLNTLLSSLQLGKSKWMRVLL